MVGDHSHDIHNDCRVAAAVAGQIYHKTLNTEGIELIRNAGGVPILAHPLHYKLKEAEIEKLLKRFTDSGLMGLEVFYSNHSLQDENFARKLAKKYNLLPSGGSDFHGSNKPAIQMGTGRGNLKVPYSILEPLADACNYKL